MHRIINKQSKIGGQKKYLQKLTKLKGKKKSMTETILDWKIVGRYLIQTLTPCMISIKGMKELGALLIHLSYLSLWRLCPSGASSESRLSILCLNDTRPHAAVGTKKLRIYSDEVTHSFKFTNIVNFQMSQYLPTPTSTWASVISVTTRMAQNKCRQTNFPEKENKMGSMFMIKVRLKIYILSNIGKIKHIFLLIEMMC